MAQTIQIKRSTTTAAPSSLSAGELAYSFKSDTKKLYIGDGSSVFAVGGQSFTDKLDNIEANADVTDATNVAAAGALMDSECASVADVKTINQALTTTSSPSFSAVTVNGNIEFDGLSGTGSVNVTDIKDEDDMSSDSATALATQQSIKAFVTGQGYVTSSGVTSISSTTTNQLTITDGSTATPELNIVTAAIADGGTGLATADQIHTFVTGQNYITLTTLSTETNINFSEFTFTASTIKSAGTMTLDPATHGDETGTVVIEGDLTVKGTTTTVNSTTVEIGDNILKLNKDFSGSTPSADAGLEVERGTQTNAFIVWDESADRWSVDPGTGTLSPLNVENVAINGGTF